jgi:hypothetical protein
MRLLPLCLALALLTFAPRGAAAQEAEIQSVIQSQIDAFLADDFPTAFTYASPNIRAIFGSPENFARMVTQGYPMVHRPKSVTMGALHDEGGVLWQRVGVTDAQGVPHVLDYQMVETPQGWKINAVDLLRAEGLGV